MPIEPKPRKEAEPGAEPEGYESMLDERLAEVMGVDVEEIRGEPKRTVFGRPVESEAEAEDAADGDEGELEEEDDDQAAEDDGAGVEDDGDGDDAAAAEEDDDEEHPDGETAAGEQAISYEDRVQMVAGLSRDGLSQRILEEMTPAEMRVAWAKRQERDVAFDGMKSDLRQFKSGAPDGATPTAAQEAPTTEPDTPARTVDLGPLAEQIGEEEAQAVQGLVNQAVQRGVEAATEPLAAVVRQMIDSTQRARLAGMVPKGHSGDWFKQVSERAGRLGVAGEFGDLSGLDRADALFDASMRLQFPNAPSPEETSRKEQVAARRKRGSMRRPKAKARSKEKLSGRDLTDAKALAAASGLSADEILDKYGG